MTEELPAKGQAMRRGSLAADSAGTLLSLFAAFAAGVAGGVLLARGLGPQGRGLFELGRTVSFVLALPAGLGLGRAVVYLLPRRVISREQLFGAVIWALGAGAVVSALVGAALTVSRGWHGLSGVEVALVSASIPFICFYMQGQAALRGVGQDAWYRGTLAARDLVFLAVLGIAFSVDVSVAAALVAWTLHWALGALVIAWRLARASGRPQLPWSRARALLRFGGSQALLVLLIQAHLRLDVVVLQGFRGPAEVGQYAVAFGLAEVLTFVGLAIGAALYPRTAESSVAHVSAGATTTAAAVRVAWILVLVGGAFLFVVGPSVIRVLLGEAFAPAGEPLRILIPGTIAMTVFIVLQNDLSGRGLVRATLMTTLAAAATNLTLCLVLVPQFGASGAALASTTTYALAAVASLFTFVRATELPLSSCLVPRVDDVRAARRALLGERSATGHQAS